MPKKDWDDPYFRYRIPKREIIVDVTASIPNFENEVDALGDVVAEFQRRKYNKICDFGAGKLRNTLFLLKKKFRVWAVEFEEAFDTPAAQKMRKKARDHGGFFELKYPREFLHFSETFDAVLLINVINIVPEKSHRVKILDECADRLKSGGLMFWMTQHGEPHYKAGVAKRLSLNDGWCYKLDKRYQSFYREYKIDEIFDIVPKSKYAPLEPNPKITSAHHRAFLFVRK
jgi:2-polyprenyl-3-methyl-5-hydroxy-6-metoxy-1,4-benzoquinol methylase